MPHTAHSMTRFSRLTYSLSTFLISMLVTVACLAVIYQIQKLSNYRNIENLAERQVESLRVFIRNDIAYIGSGANFFHSADKDDWRKFDLFAKHTIGDSHSLIGLQWMEKVEATDIATHTAELTARFPSYELHTVPK
ncbi:sensor domain-containing diguanylate cyclase, partial [Vibrio makurazakiensis]